MPQVDVNELQAAMRLHAAGRLDDAERAARRILEKIPGEPNALHMLGVIYYQRGRLDLAEPLLKASLKFADQVPEWHSNYALFCRAAGRPEEAIKHLKRSIELKPGLADSYDNLGLVLGDLRRFGEAIEAHEAAIRLQPDAVAPGHHLAQTLWNAGRGPDAIAQWRRMVEKHPRFADGHGSLCFALNKVGHSSEAMQHGKMAVKLDPRNPDAHVALAISYGYKAMHEEGVAHLNEAIRLNPRHLAAMINLGWLLERLNKHDQAADYSRMALRIEPTNVQAMLNLSLSLCNLGQFKESLEWLRGGLELDPNHAGGRSNLLWIQHFDPEVTREALFAEHRAFDAYVLQRTAGKRYAHANTRDPERPVKIAYVSPDFRRHPVATFLEPILRNQDPSKFVVSCYSSVRMEDETTARLRALVPNWYDVVELTDEELAELMHRNGEDIAIDLAGHTSDARMLTFALKPAPVQVNYLGYVNTSGMQAMDYRITDGVADPEGNDAFYCEKLVRLPCFYCYGEPSGSLEVGPLPAEANRYVTFGSLNQSMKFNDRVLKQWAELLHRVPDSRLLLMSPDSKSGADRIRESLEGFGVDSGRLTLRVREYYLKYLALYNEIDIALDPFPASGHTTTCDALWMGVPVITMAGQSYVSRLSTDVLTQIGLTELIARDPEEYLRIAGELANDRARLGSLRGAMRERMRNSIIMDARRITADLENAYREMWRAYCGASA